MGGAERQTDRAAGSVLSVCVCVFQRHVWHLRGRLNRILKMGGGVMTFTAARHKVATVTFQLLPYEK